MIERELINREHVALADPCWQCEETATKAMLIGKGIMPYIVIPWCQRCLNEALDEARVQLGELAGRTHDMELLNGHLLVELI